MFVSLSVRSQLSTAPKKNGPSIDRIDHHVRGQTHVVGQPRAQRAFLDAQHFDGRRHASQEQQHRKNDADVHRDDEVREHGEQEGDQQDGDVRTRSPTHHADEVTGFAHVPCDEEQDRRKRRERHPSREGREQQQDQHQGDRVDDAGQRAGRTVAIVGGGARNGAGGGEAAEERRQDIRDALADQFLVGIVGSASGVVAGCSPGRACSRCQSFS
jgi:hypothetical protein